MPRHDVAVPSWCQCRNCYKTARQDENVCCEVHPCRIKHDAFKKYLDNVTNQVLEEAQGKIRRVLYGKASDYFHEKQWHPQQEEEKKYTALPSCVVWEIRRRFKEQGGKYDGFPTKGELLQKVVDGRKTFKKDMVSYETIVHVAKPQDGLFTALQKLEAENKRNGVYNTLLGVISTSSAEACAERWTIN